MLIDVCYCRILDKYVSDTWDKYIYVIWFYLKAQERMLNPIKSQIET